MVARVNPRCIVSGRSHAEVVAAIKSVDGQVSLLVVDSEADEFCRNHNIDISSTSANVQTITCPDTNPYTSTGTSWLLLLLHCVSKMHQLSNGIARNYKDRF